MRKKERYEKVIAWFQENVPVAETELHYNNPYELLIAVFLPTPGNFIKSSILSGT